MNHPDHPPSQAAPQLEETLRRLEARMVRLEACLQLPPLGETKIKAYCERIEAPISAGKELEEKREEALERKIGEF